METKETKGKSNAVWYPQSHEIWVHGAIEQVRARNRNGLSHSKLGWKLFVHNFNKATNKNYERKQLQNHWDIVKEDWQLWDALLK